MLRPNRSAGGTEFNAVRPVDVPAERTYTIVVVEFLHHGEIRADGRNVVVAAQNKELVPFRILQLGPGDFCRLAFQTIKGQSEYEIFYGGEPPREARRLGPARTACCLETRQFRPCDFNNLDSVRKAFDAAAPIGADYVETVFHGCNPFSLKREPFLSRYSGMLDLPKAGRLTASSRRARIAASCRSTTSWSASAPGYHGPMWLAISRQPARRAACGRPAQVRIRPCRRRAERR